MKDLKYYVKSYCNLSYNKCNEIENVISDEYQNYKNLLKINYSKRQKNSLHSSFIRKLLPNAAKDIAKYASMPNLVNVKKSENISATKLQVKSFNTILNYNTLRVKFVKSAQNYCDSDKYYSFKKLLTWKVYRCQLKTTRESCCCSCNSDAMFEVMKGLYDCYKSKDCNHCNCVLCGQLQREDRLIADIVKSLASVGLGTASVRRKKEQTKQAEKEMQGKSLAEKEQILRNLSLSGAPLPKGKSVSEKSLIRKVTKDLGLPPESKTEKIKARMKEATKAGLLTPLEGKTHAQKEKILDGLHNMGIPLPEGRTQSEKNLIAEIAKKPLKSLVVPSEKIGKPKDTTLDGKTPKQKEKILKDLAKHGLPVPEGKTESEKNLINKVRTDLGLPPEPKTKAMKEKHAKAADVGLLQPLEGKNPKEKENILRGLRDMGIPLPEGRTPSEKGLVAMITEEPSAPSGLAPSEKIRKAKAEGLLTPLQGKSPEQKEKTLKGLADLGLPLPEGKTPSEKKLSDKVRSDLGLPPEPKDQGMTEKHAKAADAGFLQPLEGKSPTEKKSILRGLHNMDIPLPKGRTPSEKSLIAKIAKEPREPSIVVPSDKLRKAKAAGLLTPLQGKTPEQKKNIFKGLADHGLPLPKGKTSSERKQLDKVRSDLGLPPEPKNPSMRDKHAKAAEAGFLKPLEGKSPAEKKSILQGLHNMDIPLPKGRTPSEKSLIAKIANEPRKPSILAPSEKLRKAKAEGLLTPLQGKSPEQKEKTLKSLANLGLPLPEGKTPSEKKLAEKVRSDLGLPPEPKDQDMTEKHAKAADAGLLQPLEGKTPKEKKSILRGLHNMDIPLPKGRTPSEKSLIAKIAKEPRKPPVLAPSEKLLKAKAEGLLAPLQGKSPEQKEKSLKGLADLGLPLPEGKTPSEKKLVDKVRIDLGLPPEPKDQDMTAKHARAADAGLLQPLEGKTPTEKKSILKGLHNMDIPLPKGRTPSEKSLIARIAKEPRKPSDMAPSGKIRKTKPEGLLTPLQAKFPEQKEKSFKGIADLGPPLPEGKTPSEKKPVDKPRSELGFPPEIKDQSMIDKPTKTADAGLLQPLETKTPTEKKKVLRGLRVTEKSLPKGITSPEKSITSKIPKEPHKPSILAPSEKIRKAKAEGLLTPFQAKTPEQKEKALKGLADLGLPLPQGKTPSEKKLVDKVRSDLGLPPEPIDQGMTDKHAKAADAGLLQPLEGKSPKEKKSILRGLHNLDIPLPKGRTPSEKSLIAKIAKEPRKPSVLAPLEKLLKAKAEGVLTPLQGKSPEQKEKSLKGLADLGLPLPEGKTPSEKKLAEKVRSDLGLPPEPKDLSMRDKHAKAADAGLLQPLEGKTPKQKKSILRGLHKMDIPLPKGRTPSEKSLIAKIAKEPRKPSILATSEKLRKAKAEGLLTPLQGKSPEQKEKTLKSLANLGLPLPEGKTPSEKKLAEKVRSDLGLPPEPKDHDMMDKHAKAADAGLLQPLEGKTPKEKKSILRGLHNMDIPLPKGRTPSEKSLIAKIAKEPRKPSVLAPSEKLRKAKAEGLLTPLQGKSPEQKEKTLKSLANLGLPLPEGKTPSEKKLAEKIRSDLGLPPEPKDHDMMDKHAKAADAGLLQPLEGKTPKEKKSILRGLHNMDIPLPKGRTPSEKSLIAKIAKEPRKPSVLAPSEKLRKAKAEGLLTPLQAKSPEQKEKTLKSLANLGLPLPEGKTPSEKKLAEKVRSDLGLPPEPKDSSMRNKHAKAADAGLLQPLEGKTPKEKKSILRGLHNMEIPLPKGRTPSEKSLIAEIANEPRKPSILAPSEKLRKAKAARLLTPLQGKTPEQKEKALKSLADLGLPLPEPKTKSEKKLVDKIRTDLGLPPAPEDQGMTDKHVKAADAGLLQPLEGKSPKEKKSILRGLHNMDIPLPKGRTPSEKSLIAKIAKEPRKPSVLAPSEKLRKAKAEGLLTPLQDKSPEQKEKTLKNLANLGLPLPEGKTPSEKKLGEKVRSDLGLPPEPKDQDMTEKHAKAADAGFLQPLEGKTPAEKKSILRGLHDLEIPLPKGRTPSEKSLIAKIAKEPRKTLISGPSEKLRKAKAQGLLVPLQGKSPEQKDKILRDHAELGLPLPQGKTPSEKGLIDKVRTDLGLPPEPKTKSMRDKYAKAADAGLLQPLEGKTPTEKKNILRSLHRVGIPLPEGRTPSEKSLVAKVAEEPRTLRALLPSEKIYQASKAGLLTPLQDKTPEQQNKILRDLANLGLPLPEGKSPAEKNMIAKISSELGLPPPPETLAMRDKHIKAANAGLLVPLEGKPLKEKGKNLQALADMDITLPEGRTPSEKDLISKIKAAKEERNKLDKKTGKNITEGTGPVDECICGLLTPESQRVPKTIPSIAAAKIDKARKDGLFTPLEAKFPQEKKLKELASAGLPLPRGKTFSEKTLKQHIKDEFGIPEDILATSLTPLQGKTPDQKQKILKDRVAIGLPLPKGKTASEKDLVKKIRASTGYVTPSPSKKLRKTEAAGLLTPRDMKTPARKEKISGVPKIPEGKSPSEKELIQTPVTRKLKSKRATKTTKLPRHLTPLTGKTPEQKEKILKSLARAGEPLPDGITTSEKKSIAKVKAEIGLPPKPSTPSLKEKYKKAQADGIITPLEGKTRPEKEKILKKLTQAGLPLPEGKSPSEKAMINKIRSKSVKPPTLSRRMKAAKAAGLLTPLEGKTPKQKEDILKRLTEAGIPLPEGKTPSEKKMMNKIRAEVGLPPEPKTEPLKEKYKKAVADGLITPLENKTPAEKANIVRKLQEAGIPLPEGRTPSEKTLIKKAKAGLLTSPTPSQKLQATKKDGLLTPKPKKKSLKKSLQAGVPLQIGKTPSENNLINKLRSEVGLQGPLTPSLKEKYKKAEAAGLITPLDKKTPEQKENILKKLHDTGIPLPEGRSPSEKKIIKKIKAELPKSSIVSEQQKGAKTAGLLTPLDVKTPEQKKDVSTKVVCECPDFVEPSDRGLPAKPQTTSLKPPTTSQKLQAAKGDGLITPLEGKSPEQKKKILKKLLQAGTPLPAGKTPSENDLIAKLRSEVGLPQVPITPSLKEKYKKAEAAGIITPLDKKTPEEKENILKKLHEAGIPLPKGRSPSEKKIIKKIPGRSLKPSVDSQRLKAAKAAGLLSPLKGKTPEQKKKILQGLVKIGMPLPEGTTPSEKNLINNIRAETGLPPEPKTSSIKEKYAKALADGIITPLEGKTSKEKDNILRNLHDAGIPLPEARTPSEKAIIKRVKSEPRKLRTPSERKVIAKDAGLLTPLKGKTPDEREKILKGLAQAGLPLPEDMTPSEKKKIDEVRAETGLPPEPKTPSMKEKYKKAIAGGIITPLEGKTPEEKKDILGKLIDAGLPLPESRSPSEKSFIKKRKSEKRKRRASSKRLDAAKAAGLLTPLEGKTPEEKEKILKGLAESGLPLPEAKTPSEKKMINKIRADTGLPPEPTTPSMKAKYKKALDDGIITPLEGKTPSEKENIVKKLQERGLPLPVDKIPSKKSKTKTITVEPHKPKTPSQRKAIAKDAGLLTPVKGKTPEEREKILKGLAQAGLPLPEDMTPSETKKIDKVRADTGLPPEPKTPSLREKYKKAVADGIVTPLEGKTPEEKKQILGKLIDAGLPLPEGRSPSEKSMIKKNKAERQKRKPSSKLLDAAKATSLLTPLEGKTPEEKEKILKGLADSGLPLPEAKTPSEKKMISKIKADIGLPPEPKTPSMKEMYRALDGGIMTPLEGKTPSEKENIVKKLQERGLPLPVDKTPSKKSKTKTIKAEPHKPKTPSQRKAIAKDAGLLTPLKGKTPEQREKILKGLAQAGLPLPEDMTPSERKKIDKVKAETGLPPEPKTPSMKEKYKKAISDGIITPLEGKTPEEKKEILGKLIDAGLPLPEGRTPSEKSMIKKNKAEKQKRKTSTQRLDAAKAAGLLTPLEGKTPEEKQKILKGLAESGLPLPEAKTPSEKKMINKIRADTGLPPEPKTPSSKEKYKKAQADGIITPLQGKTPAEKLQILKNLQDADVPLPEGRTPSEKSLIKKVKTGLLKPFTPSQRIKAAKGKTPEEREKITKGLIDAGLPLSKVKTASVKAGLPAQKAMIKKDEGVGAEVKHVHSQAGIVENLEDITKTTVCDQACGCDKKKIRFKHSYIKIRVTSPDISSYCPCPEECIPRVKSGVFVDNEGIKVTIGSVVEIPSYFKISTEVIPQYLEDIYSNMTLFSKHTDSSCRQTQQLQNNMKKDFEKYTSEGSLKYILTTSHIYSSSSSDSCNQSESMFQYQKRFNKSDTYLDYSRYFNNESEIFRPSALQYNDDSILPENMSLSNSSILILKSETSLNFSSSCDSSNSSNILSFMDNSEISSISNFNSSSDLLISHECLTNADEGLLHVSVDRIYYTSTSANNL